MLLYCPILDKYRAFFVYLTVLVKMMTPSNFDELKDLVAKTYDSLSTRLKQVADFIMAEPLMVAVETMSVISDKANVPLSTLSRFSNTIGFSGFSEMQVLFRDQFLTRPRNYKERMKQAQNLDKNSPSTAKDIFEQLGLSNVESLENIMATLSSEKINSAINTLHNANTIYIQGVRRAYPVASYLWYVLMKSDNNTVLIDDHGGMSRALLKKMNKNDVLFVTTFKPHAQESIDVIERAHEIGTPIIAITDDQMTEYGRKINICFEVDESAILGFRSLNNAMYVAQSLVVSLMLKQNRLQNKN